MADSSDIGRREPLGFVFVENDIGGLLMDYETLRYTRAIWPIARPTPKNYNVIF